MRAVQATGFGGPEVLVPGAVKDPVPGPGEVVVEVSVADVIFLDILVRRGMPGPWTVQPPYVPGSGVAGRVSAVGERVDASLIGRRVAGKPGRGLGGGEGATVAETAAMMPPVGGYAERAVLPAQSLQSIPDELDEPAAAALINDGTTARQLAEAAKVQPGEWVLITPASAGLGSLLTQLVRAAGGRVIAGVGGPAVDRSTPGDVQLGERKLALVIDRGAEVALDYGQDGWAKEVREVTGGNGVNVVLDGVGGEVGRTAFGSIATGGRFFAFGAPGGGFAVIDDAEVRQQNATVIGLMDLMLTPADMARLAGEALAEAAAGRMAPLIGRQFDLSDAGDAHAAIEARAVMGKTLLRT